MRIVGRKLGLVVLVALSCFIMANNAQADRVDELISQLTDEESNSDKWSVIHELGEIGDSRATIPLIQQLDLYLEDRLEDWEDLFGGDTYAVVSALGKIGNPRAIEPLIATFDKVTFEELIFGIQWKSSGVGIALNATSALRMIGQPVTSYLIDELETNQKPSSQL